MHADNCFEVSTYQRMLAGQLPLAEMDKVCRHLENCARCLQMVQNLPEDSLVASLRNRQWPANVLEPAFVRDLAQKVLKRAEGRGRMAPGFVMFSCSDCGNRLKVKEEFAGKKVKCPKCGQVVVVPSDAASQGGMPPDEKTRAPQDVSSPNNQDAPTMPPVDARTVAPVPKDDTNLVNQPQAMQEHVAEQDRSLIDFLAPPLEPDEIGRLGNYRVLKVLGAGGMGVVFKAEDPSLKRLVAIKAMLPAVAASASAKQRFLREAQAAAAIKHNHIVTIFQVGEDRNVPFLAMEFLEGEPLDDRLKRETTLPLPEVVRIGREMALGMAAAHKRSLIHRDIKPANTWLEAESGNVKILDFGLARATDDQAHLTQSGAIIGTPQYMAPEQGRGEKLDARCDLWSLGVVLYRMCTGEMPFKGADTVSTLMAVAMNNPPPPAKVNRAVPADFSKLIMKLLEKDPAKRLGSAQEVADALRTLEQSSQRKQEKAAPVVKPKPERAGRVSDRSKSRKPLLLALAGGLVAAIALGIVVFWPTPDGVIRIESDDPAVEVVFDKDGPTIKGADNVPIRLLPGKHGFVVKRGEFTFMTDNFEMKKGDKITLKIDFQKGKMLSFRNDQKFGEKDFPPPGDPQVAKNDPPRKEGPPQEKTLPPGPLTASLVQKFEGHTGLVHGVALSGDGKHALTGSFDGTAILWEAASGKKIQTFQAGAPILSVALSGDLQQVLTAGSGQPIAILWDTASGKIVQRFSGHTNNVDSVAMSGDGKLVLTGSRDTTAILWDAASGKKIQTFEGHPTEVKSVALSGDGKLVLTGSGKLAILWDAASGKKIQTIQGHNTYVNGVALSGDGKYALIGSNDKTATLWDAGSGKKLQTYQGHTHHVTSVALSTGGKHVLTGSLDKTAILWDAASGKKIQTFEGHTAEVRSVALSGDGKHVLTGSIDKTAILWEVKAAPPPVTPPPPPRPLTVSMVHTFEGRHVAVSADGKLVVTGSAGQGATLWDAATGKRIQNFNGHLQSALQAVDLSGDGKRVLTASAVEAILWDTASGKKIHSYGGYVSGLALSADGERVLTGSQGVAILWNAAGKRIHTFAGHAGQVTSVALSRDGTRALSGAADATAILWDTVSGKKLQTFTGHTSHVVAVALSGDGKRALTGSEDKTAILWDTATGNKLQTFAGHTYRVSSVALSGDGTRALTGDALRTAILWDVASGTKLHTFENYTGSTKGVALSGDGNLAFTSGAQTVTLWEVKAAPPPATSPPPLTASMVQKYQGHTAGVTSVALSGDGQHVLTGSADHSAILWDAANGKKIHILQGHTKEVNGVALSGDGKLILTGSHDTTAILWDAASGKKIQTCQGHTSIVSSVALSGDGRLALTGSHDRTAILWEAATGKKLQDFQGHTNGITSVALSSDGKHVLTGAWAPDKTGTAILWEAATGKKIQTFQGGHTNNINGVALSGDGRLAVTGSLDGKAILWDAASGIIIQTFLGHNGAVTGVALSGDGKHVLTASGDQTAILWDAASGKKIHTFQGHTSGVTSVAPSSDGKRVLTGSWDKAAILWEVKAAPPSTSPPSGGFGLAFDASLKSSVGVPSLNFVNEPPLTIEAYATPATDNLVSRSGPLAWAGPISLDQAGAEWRFGGNFGKGPPIFVTQKPVQAKRRVHLAGVWTKDRLVLFVDGKKAAETARPNLQPTIAKFYFMVGHNFDGVISALRISKTVRYTDDFTPKERFEPDINTIILYHFDEGSGDVLKDSSGNGHHGKIVGAKWVKADGSPILTGSTPPPFAPLNLAEKEAKKLQEDTAAKLQLPVEATNKIGMKLMLIPPTGAALPEAYYLGKYEVTQGEFEMVMGYNPSQFGPQNAKVADTSNLPVEMVNWFDGVEFCNKLSERDGLKPYYELTSTKRGGKDARQIDAAEVKILGGSGYHLPTEAEWEHGCRAGTKTLYHFGDKDADLPDYAWFGQNCQNRTHGVGEKKPNAFGLYDMHGNVWEWCEDQYDPKGGPDRVHRGGGWNDVAGNSRAAYRSRRTPSRRDSYLGFRLARNPSSEAKVAENPPPFVPLNLAEKEAKKLQEDTAAKLKLPVETTNKIGMKMMLIPPAGPALPEAYYLGKYEVTQGEWQQVMGYNPSRFGPQPKKGVTDASRLPVEQVGWYDCVEFCNKLSEQEGLKPYYELTVTNRDPKDGKQIDAAEVKILGGRGYHLPTEAAWEHGCRAGTKTLYYFGDKDADLPDYAWFNPNSQGRTHGVGDKKPNAFGLHDAHGNVWEWCEDPFDPKGGPARVYRGGCWGNDADGCRAADRRGFAPAARSNRVGLRVARVPSSEAKVGEKPPPPGR